MNTRRRNDNKLERFIPLKSKIIINGKEGDTLFLRRSSRDGHCQVSHVDGVVGPSCKVNTRVLANFTLKEVQYLCT